MIYLSIVIPIFNEEKFIIETLDSLISQDYPLNRYELLVVDGMSTDTTKKLVKDFIKKNPDVNVFLLDNPKRLSSSGRNIGFKVAKGQLIGVVDGHVYIPNDKLFFNMERLKEKTGVMCLARPQPLNVPGMKVSIGYWIAVARKTWLGHSRNSLIFNTEYEGVVEPTSSGFAYDRQIFDKIGYVDETFDAAEDVEFNYRVLKADFTTYISPDLLVYYYPRESFRALFKQQVRYGEGRVRFIQKYPESFTKETLVPPGIFLMFALFPLAFLLKETFYPLSYLIILAFCLYSTIVLVTGIKEIIGKQKYLYAVFFVIAGIVVTHLGLGWGIIKAKLKS